MSRLKEPSCCLPIQNCCLPQSNLQTMKIEFLYLDLSVCERCQETGVNLDQAIQIIKPTLNELGYAVQVIKININTEALALKYRFLSSPTIRINDNDIEFEIKENQCLSCGELCTDQVDCRVFTYKGTDYHEPPKAMILDAILRNIYAPNSMPIKPQTPYQIPVNLMKFYLGKKNKDD